mgnify:CR=1 FL=1|jgi:hypothetical protein
MAKFPESRLELIVIKVNRTEMDDFFDFLGADLANHFDFFPDNFRDLLLFNVFCYQVWKLAASNRFKILLFRF